MNEEKRRRLDEEHEREQEQLVERLLADERLMPDDPEREQAIAELVHVGLEEHYIRGQLKDWDLWHRLNPSCESFGAELEGEEGAREWDRAGHTLGFVAEMLGLNEGIISPAMTQVLFDASHKCHEAAERERERMRAAEQS